jgi:hypothetical protein
MFMSVHCDALLQDLSHASNILKWAVPSNAVTLKVTPSRSIADQDRAPCGHRLEDYMPKILTETKQTKQVVGRKNFTDPCRLHFAAVLVRHVIW